MLDRPRSLHFNGKVERVQKTALYEFYSMADLDDPELQARLDEWVFHYNWMRGSYTLGVFHLHPIFLSFYFYYFFIESITIYLGSIIDLGNRISSHRGKLKRKQ